MESRLSIGTAQFGMAYGVANQKGQIALGAAREILTRGWAAGIRMIDTAIAYGESESILGELGLDKWRVVSKIPRLLEDNGNVADSIHNSICGSLERLRIPSLYAVLLHYPQQLLEDRGPAIFEALRLARDAGLVDKIGISIYGPEELPAIMARFEPDLVQAPFNLVDRRLLTSGWLSRLHSAGVEVHVRSTFLQGLLLMNIVNRPAKFDRWRPLWTKWQTWLDSTQSSAVAACLNFSLSQPEISRVVIGIDSPEHLNEILQTATGSTDRAAPNIENNDIDLINPTRWANF
jgi:aryl-alcohol dehydrogenase-like predicted oxidoreductase